MPNTDRQPEMWTLGSGASLIATGAVGALFVGFFVICLIRRLGVQALAFGGLGTLAMIALAVVQWRVMKQRSGGPKG